MRRSFSLAVTLILITFAVPHHSESVNITQANQADSRRREAEARQVMPEQSRELNRDELKKYVEAVLRRLPVTPGLGVAVVRGDEIIFAGGFGLRDVEAQLPVTAQTGFYIASTTKSFTGTTARLLADEGKLDLDAPIKTYFPELALKAPLSVEQISVRDLLTHRHGIRNEPVDFRMAYSGQHTPVEIYQLLSEASVPVSPAFRYANIGYIIAALAMERATGETWQKSIEHKIITPLGLTATTPYATKARASGDLALPYQAAEDGRFVKLPYKEDNTMHAAGGMISSAEDLAKWLVVNINAGRYGGRQAFPAASLEEIHAPQINQRRKFYEYERYAYGLGWNIATYKGEKFIHCFGDFPGFRPHVSFLPERKLGVVVLANESRDSFTLPDLIASDIYDHLTGRRTLNAANNPRIEEYAASLQKERQERSEREAKRKEQNALTTPTLALAAYAGTYQNAQFGTIVINTEGNALLARFGNLTAPLAHQGGDMFEAAFIPGNSLKLTFKTNQPGSVQEISMMGQTFKRI